MDINQLRAKNSGAGKSVQPEQRVLDAMPDAPKKPKISSLVGAKPEELAFATVSSSPKLPATGRDLQNISIDLIDPNPFAPREIYTSATIERRANALRDQGQHDPIHVIPNPDAPGRYIIADGWTRVRACREHHVFDSLLAEIHGDLSVQEAAWYGYAQNEERQDHFDLDRAQFYEKMMSSANMTATDVARQAKITPSAMTYYRAYARLPQEVMEVMHENPEKFGSTVAYYLNKLHQKQGVRKALALAEKFAAEDRPVRWLVDRVQGLLTPTKRKTSAYDNQLSYENGYLRTKGDEYQLSIKVSEDQKEEFERALKVLLETVAIRKSSATSGREDD